MRRKRLFELLNRKEQLDEDIVKAVEAFFFVGQYLIIRWGRGYRPVKYFAPGGVERCDEILVKTKIGEIQYTNIKNVTNI